MNPNGNGNKPVSPEIDATPERDRERDESLGRFRSAESRARSLANLKPADSTRAYQLGQLSGERRANDALFKQELLSVLKAKMPKDKQGRTYRRAVAESLVKIALKGGLAGVAACRLIAERTDGALPSFEDAFQPERILIQINLNKVRFPEIAPPKLPE